MAFNYNLVTYFRKKKMVVVEKYLKSHFGEISATCEVGEKKQNISRVPLIPTDIDIGE